MSDKKMGMTEYEKSELCYHIFATIVIILFIVGMVCVGLDT